ncbi:hypothetical protein FRB99_005347 [Tulasnella sp. 403]|nr:hypothetical protein FRB99_005347 [Tulasnella sp. 403]
MDSPIAPASPSPSTPSSGDEDYYGQDAPFSTQSPVYKKRAVSSVSGVPQHTIARTGARRGDIQVAQGVRGAVAGIVGMAQAGQAAGPGQKEELVDIAYMNDLKALIGDPFDDTSPPTRT